MDTLISLVTEGSRRFGARPALLIRPSFRTLTWTYRDLGDVVPRAAGVLADAGVARGDRVIIWAVNRPEWAIGFLAIAHIGAVAVPLDVRHAPDFAARVASQTGARLVLTSRQTADAAAALALPTLPVELLPDRARHRDPLSPAPIGPADLAEVVFTSGTTGEPKGAMISHGNLMASAAASAKVFPIRDGERLVSVLPLSHLFEQGFGLLMPLSHGGSVTYPVSRQPAVLLRTFRDTGASILLIVPQGLRLLDTAIQRRVDQAGRTGLVMGLRRLARRLPMRARRSLFRPILSQLGGRLRTIGVGASALDPDQARRWLEMGVEVLQGYGATEMSPTISFTRPGANRLGTVGQAIPGVEIRVADDGELLVRGPNRFQGYWANPEATAAAIDTEGWYHTGDLGTLAADGFLTLRGRKKDMIALPDGQKVYPEDVEAVLERDPRVADSAVVGWPPGEGLRVHAVLLLDPSIADGDGSVGGVAEDVVSTANATLGAHQQIRGWTIWPDDDLPRTHALKVKKHVVLERLAVVGGAADAMTARETLAQGRADGAAPGAPVAADPLIRVIAGVADVAEGAIGPDLHLSSDLNLDSLQRVEVLGVIEEELGVYIDDDALDPDATVAELAAMVAAATPRGRSEGAHSWPLSPLARLVGMALQAVLVRPYARLIYRIRVSGLEHLRDLHGPVLFTPNHCLHSDNAIVLTVLPRRWRWRLSIAAAADDIFGNRLQGFAVSILANAFPLAREGAVRRSLELLGRRLDRGFSILIFPEGKLTVGGPMAPFKAGVGLIAVDGAVPVVPIKLTIRQMSRVDAPGNPLRGEVEVAFGRPLRFDSDADPAAATLEVERAVAAL